MWKADGKTTTLPPSFVKKRDKLESELDLNLRKKLAKCYIWSVAEYVAETSESRTEIPGKVLKCDGGEGGGYQLARYIESRRRGMFYIPVQSTEGRLTGLVPSCLGTAFRNM